MPKKSKFKEATAPAAIHVIAQVKKIPSDASAVMAHLEALQKDWLFDAMLAAIDWMAEVAEENVLHATSKTEAELRAAAAALQTMRQVQGLAEGFAVYAAQQAAMTKANEKAMENENGEDT